MQSPTRLLLISDSHGARSYVSALIKQFTGQNKPDCILFAGDGAGIEYQLSHICPVYAVQGNCDQFSRLPLELTVCYSGFKLYLTHGHQQRVKHTLDLLAVRAQENEAAIVVYGHTHQQDISLVNRIYCINPGALRDGQYALLTLEKGGQVRPSFHQLI